MIKITTLALSMALFVSGCTQQPKKTESAFIVLKTPSMKYADMGFISDHGSTVKIDIYAAGQPIVAWEINAVNVCVSALKCMSKKKFNEDFLTAAYPDTLLENIFKSKAIFSEKNMEKTENGFTQILKKDAAYDISYKVEKGKRTFRDSLNKILIKVREQ